MSSTDVLTNEFHFFSSSSGFGFDLEWRIRNGHVIEGDWNDVITDALGSVGDVVHVVR